MNYNLRDQFSELLEHFVDQSTQAEWPWVTFQFYSNSATAVASVELDPQGTSQNSI
jgi:hypothetical protein